MIVSYRLLILSHVACTRIRGSTCTLVLMECIGPFLDLTLLHVARIKAQNLVIWVKLFGVCHIFQGPREGDLTAESGEAGGDDHLPPPNKYGLHKDTGLGSVFLADRDVMI